MKIALFGCGAMGRAAAVSLAAHEPDSELILVDRETDHLLSTVEAMAEAGYRSRPLTLSQDLLNPDSKLALRDLLARIDVAALALPWQPTHAIMRAAVATRCAVVSITRPDYPDFDAMRAWIGWEHARILFPCGLEPGLTEILAVATAARLASVQSLVVRCGGIPAKPVPPLGYRRLFDSWLPLTPRDAYILEHGRLRTLRRFDAAENFEVAGVGTLECHHDGMLPWLGEHPAMAAIAKVEQKTVRWPGFVRAAVFLDQCGLLSEVPIAVADGVKVAPRHVLEATLAPLTRAVSGERDLTILRVEATGLAADGRAACAQTELIDRSSGKPGSLTSMARTTGFTLASVARMLARGDIGETGLLFPHHVITGARLMRLLSDLQADGVSIDTVMA